MIFLDLFRVSGKSMEPTFRQGQKLLVSGIPYLFTKPKVGDLVVVKDPRDSKPLLKRIIRCHPERSEGSLANARISNKLRDSSASPQNDMGDVKYFVSGDNPKESTDSRAFGSIQKTDIVGKVIWG